MLTTTSRIPYLLTTILLALGAALALSGCGDEQSSPASPGAEELDQALEDLASVDAIFLSATTNSVAMASAAAGAVETLVSAPGGSMGSAELGGSPLDSLLSSTCPAISYSTGDESFSLLLDYGTGCTPNGGEVEISGAVGVDAALLDPGVEFSITWEAYKIDGVSLDGTTEATLIGDTLSWVIDGTITEDGAVATGTLNLTATLVANSPTTLDDDELIVSGSGTITSGGMTSQFTINPQAPLVLRTGCDCPVSGEVTVLADLGTAGIDYGDGDCDSMATISIGIYSREIDLSGSDLSELLGY